MKDLKESIDMLNKHVKNNNLKKHMYACAAAMKNLAIHFVDNEDLWETVGLIHDIDYERTADDTEMHGTVGKQMLSDEGYSSEICDAVEAHVGRVPRDTQLKKAIYSVDPLTGLIVACALIRPEKILAPIDLAFVKKRMKEKRFAANANRQPIHDSVEMGIEEDEFITIVLNAMKGISDKMGL